MNRSYGYDSQGRLTSATGATFTWTGLDRLASATVGGTTASYTYDGEGRRVSASVGGQTQLFVLLPDGNILAEYDGAGTLLVEHVYLEGRRIGSRKADGERIYLQHDALGSVWQVTGSSGAAVRSAYRYWPFGEVWAGPPPVGDAIFADEFETGDTLRWSCTRPGSCLPGPTGAFAEPLYTGKPFDEETGLFYFEARQMDPRVGRFISPDEGPLE